MMNLGTNFNSFFRKIPLFVLSVIFALSIVHIASAETLTNVKKDEAKNVESAFQNAKDALENLLSINDSGQVDEVAIRTKAFMKVLELSVAECKDYAAKLIAVPKNKDYDDWVAKSLEKLTYFTNWYNKKKESISSTNLSLEQLKEIALDFKNLRDTEYIPFIRSLQTFLLVVQESNAVETANKRLLSIKKDLSKITFKSKDQKVIDLYLASSSLNIANARLLNEKAYDMFLKLYVLSTSTEENSSSSDFEVTAETTTSSTISSSSMPLETSTAEYLGGNTSTKSATSSDKGDENTQEVNKEKISDEKIRDLVQKSLSEVKNAYQNFIALSNYVRKLLKQ